MAKGVVKVPRVVGTPWLTFAMTTLSGELEAAEELRVRAYWSRSSWARTAHDTWPLTMSAVKALV